MELNKKQVDNLANKLLIGLTDEENKMVLEEFAEIEQSIDLINEIENIDNVEPMTHPYDLYTATLREDEPEESVSLKEIMQNVKQSDGREIKVPKTV